MDRIKLIFPYLVLSGIAVVVIYSNIPAGRATEHAAETRTMCAPCGMEVDPGTALTSEIRGRTHYFCGPGCREQVLAGRAGNEDSETPSDDRLVDVVCNMEVNAAWDIRTEHAGKTYYFCAEQCKVMFVADPEPYLSAKCIVCQVPLEDRATYTATYLGEPYELCSEAHRALFKEDPAEYFMHTMWGIPSWLYYSSIALVLIVSFGFFDWLSRRGSNGGSELEGSQPRAQIDRPQTQSESKKNVESQRPAYKMAASASIALPIISSPSISLAAPIATDKSHYRDRFDLLSIHWINAAIRSRLFRFTTQLIFVGAFLLIIAAGLFGNQNPALNIAPILTWTIWWALLIVLIMFAGKAWCYVCPWDAIAGWAEKLSLWKKTDDGLSLGLRWPKIIRNISIATILFVGLTWIELGFGVTMKPRITAYLAIAMLLMAVVSALLFDRKSFCRYGCLVGRVSGLYALFAGTEVRPRQSDVCQKCRTKECIKGSDKAYGCPTFLYPGKLETNTYCIQCMECIQACPHDNLAVNLRPWGSDLAVEGKPRTDEAYLALLMLSITGFHGLTMTPVWQQLTDAIRQLVDVGKIVGFSIGMAGLMLAPIGIYAILVALSKALGKRDALKPLTYRDYFVRYAYALLPIALFYHIAHNLEHLLMEGPKVMAMVSDPFGWNWNLFGTAGWTIPPMISLDKLWLIQVLLVLIGHVYSLWVAQKSSLRLFGSARAAFRSQLPMLVGMICFSIFSLWLLKQPMEMRTSAM